MEALRQGTKVRIKSSGQLGTVAYVRFAPPDYSHPLVYSILLDEKFRPKDYLGIGYAGSIFKAEEVEPV